MEGEEYSDNLTGENGFLRLSPKLMQAFDKEISKDVF